MPSAAVRLKKLPPLFTREDLADQGISGGSEWATLARWRKDGLIESAGPRAGLFYNLVADPRGREALLPEALRWHYPEAVVAGLSALNRAHWTPQLSPPSMQVAVMGGRRRSKLLTLHGLELRARPKAWFTAVAPHARSEGQGGFRVLDPAWALADCWTWRDFWSSDPDDLELDDLDDPQEAIREVGRALEALGADDEAHDRLEDAIEEHGLAAPAP